MAMGKIVPGVGALAAGGALDAGGADDVRPGGRGWPGAVQTASVQGVVAVADQSEPAGT